MVRFVPQATGALRVTFCLMLALEVALDALGVRHVLLSDGQIVVGRSAAKAGATPQLPNLSLLNLELLSRGNNTQSFPLKDLTVFVEASMA